MQSNHDVLSTRPRGVRLTGRTAWVTGSTSGIGEAVEVLDAMAARTVAVRWLLTDEAAVVHGSSIDVDGGILAARAA